MVERSETTGHVERSLHPGGVAASTRRQHDAVSVAQRPVFDHRLRTSPLPRHSASTLANIAGLICPFAQHRMARKIASDDACGPEFPGSAANLAQGRDGRLEAWRCVISPQRAMLFLVLPQTSVGWVKSSEPTSAERVGSVDSTRPTEA